MLNKDSLILEFDVNNTTTRTDLEIVNGEVIICSAKTANSKRAANQALAYLDSNKDVKQIKSELRYPKEVFI